VRQFTLIVTEIKTLGRQILVRCEGEGGPAPISAPGQVCLAQANLPAQPFLRVPLYPFHQQPGVFEFLISPAHPYAGLEPGMALDLIGPCGRGFDLPLRAAHLLLIADSSERLLPLIHLALERQFAITCLIPQTAPLPELPSAIEIQRGPLTAELVTWADLIALDVPTPLDTAREIRACAPAATRPASFIQAFITPPLPCGVGACQACWVEPQETHARKLACVDGPVFRV
jgi:hypothetical protein